MNRQIQTFKRRVPRIDGTKSCAMLLVAMLTAFGPVLAGATGPAFANEAFEAAGFEFSPPPTWIRLPVASAMRKAQFRVPNPGPGYDGIVIFYQFPPNVGGTAERNIERWHSQFKEPNDVLGAKVETRGKGARRLHYFRATGTLLGRDGEMPGYSLHAAVLEAPSGRVFVRFVAPAAVARANQAAFRELIERAFDD